MQRRIDNPFTPSFGGMPERFFGRSQIIDRFSRAMENRENPDRVLFLTGPRGCGKTALLERLSGIARKGKWLVVDAHSKDSARTINRTLQDSRLAITGVVPKVGIAGVEASLDVARTTASVASDTPDLTKTLLDRASSLTTRQGILISIDEIQKVPEPDAEDICAAVQMARRKGLPVMLVMAGLPGSKERVAGFKGCTFMQRVEDLHMRGLGISETLVAFAASFASVSDLETDDEFVRACANLSQGYPYLVQLVGYLALEQTARECPVGMMHPSVEGLAFIEDEVYATYRENVLVPSTRSLRQEGRDYLRAMAGLLDKQGFAKTGEVASSLGKTTTQLASCRQNLLNRRLIMSGGYGKVCYGLPYLSRFSTEIAVPERVDFSDEWIPR